MIFQTPGTKYQTKLKLSPCGILPQTGSPKAKFHRASIKCPKQVWSAGGGLVMVLYLKFVICDLEFLLFQYFETALLSRWRVECCDLMC